MPKYGSNFNDLLMITCNTELREALVTISHMMGMGGAYSGAARNLLARAAEEFYLDLEPRKQREYDTILKAVQAQTEIQRQRRAEKVRKKMAEGKTLRGVDHAYTGQ